MLKFQLSQILELAQTIIGEQDAKVQDTRWITEKVLYVSLHLFDHASYLH